MPRLVLGAWVAGTAKEKGSEYGLVGVIVGVLLALVINMYRKEGPSLSLAEQQRANKEIYVASQVAPMSDTSSTAAGKLQVYGLLP